MKHVRLSMLVLSAVLALFFAAPTFAQMPTVSVPESCSVADTDSGVHDYSGQFLGICALAVAYDQGVISDYTLQDFSFGLFLASLNGVSPSATEFWNIAQNGTDASVGLSDLVLTQGDTLTFQRKDFISNTDVGESVTFAVSLQSSGGSGGGGGGQIEVPFNVSAALSFLSEKQKTDGSFGVDFVTDWAAIALASADPSPAQEHVRAYLLSRVAPLSSITDYERHAMALLALGIDPYTGTGTDYITPIVAAYDGTQIGDPSLVNDDIFALFPLPKAGYDADSDIIQHTIAFILAKQRADGSWEESVDLTAAAIQALAPFDSMQGVPDVLSKAKKYMHDARRPDGNWGNSFQASWVVQALHTLNVPLSSWIQDGKSPMSALASMQENDGGIEPVTSSEATRIWATSYAVPAALARQWNDILHSFSKPTGAALGVSTTTEAATSTDSGQATTTPVESSVRGAMSTATTTIESVVAAPFVTAVVEAVIPETQKPSKEEPGQEKDVISTTSLAQVAAVASADVPWFDISWLWLMSSILGLTALMVFLQYLWEKRRGN